MSVEAGASQQAGVGQRVPSRRPVHPLLTHTQQLLRLTRECPLTLIHTHRERERERERDRQTDRHTQRERETHTEKERERERQTDRHTHNTDTQRERERQTDRHTHTERQTDRQTHFLCELLLLLGYPFMNHITKRVKVNMILKSCVHVLTCSV